MKRIVLTLAAVAAALLLLWAMFRTGSDSDPSAQAPSPQTPAQSPQPAAAADSTTPATSTPTEAAADQPTAAEAAPALNAAPDSTLGAFRVRQVTETQPEPIIGSVDPASNFRSRVTITPWGAGVKAIDLADYKTEINSAAPYSVQHALVSFYTPGPDNTRTPSYRYPFAVYAVVVNGQTVNLWDSRWQYLSERSTLGRSAVFQLTVEDDNANAILRIERSYTVEPGRYDILISHRIENLTTQPLTAALSHYGPGDLPSDAGYVGDRRHITAAHLVPASSSDPNAKRLTTAGYDLHRDKVLAAESASIWPGPEPDPAAQLLWAAASNRYFAAAVHGPVDRATLSQVSRGQVWADASLDSSYASIRRVKWNDPDDVKRSNQLLLTLFDARPVTLQPAGDPAASNETRIELYAGPKDPHLLEDDPLYASLQLDDLIVYNLGGLCAFCTFAWLANLLIGFLTLIHAALNDWGAAIIVLVAVVRLILHPLTKNAQLNMMKLSRQMQAIQPEVERLKEKFKDDQSRQQQEMLKLYKEKGVNPATGALGCLPMFLQTPIWIALFATLYYAIELRHQPAFWGVFQNLSGGSWQFLADLSSPDRFIPLPGGGFAIPFVGWRVDAVNVLPILMALVFWFQQKYMTAQTVNMTDQQRTQQQMMKYMMLLFPFMLYKAPSGLALYMVTSSTVGIIESRRVRKHLKVLEAKGELDKPRVKKPPKPGSLMDKLSKIVEERQKQIQQAGGKGPGSRRPNDKKPGKRRD